jgi:hypothetical protein
MMEQSLRNALLWIAGSIAAGALAGLLHFRQMHAAASSTVAAVTAAAPPAVAATPAAAAAAAGPQDSDSILLEGLRGLIGAAGVNQYVEPTGLVRRVVATVDTLPRTHWMGAPAARLPVRSAIGGFIATGDDQQRTPMAAENFARYTPYIQLLAALDTRALAQLYRSHAAWFQQAYDELMPVDAPPSFDARLAQTIDVLLAAPEPADPVLIYRPEASYQFANPDFEALPVGEKLLLRMGPVNAGLVKGKLRDLKAALSAPPP